MDYLHGLGLYPGKNTRTANINDRIAINLRIWRSESEGMPEFRGVPVDRLVGEGWRDHFSVATGENTTESEKHFSVAFSPVATGEEPPKKKRRTV